MLVNSLIKARLYSGLTIIARLGVWLPALLVLIPIMMLFMSWSQLDFALWQHLLNTSFTRILHNTFQIMLWVGLGVMILGTGLGWLLAMCRFPGSKWLQWGLALPLAIPSYVLSFCTLAIWDFYGPVQQLITAKFSVSWDARQPFLLMLTLTAALYPYVYLLTRNAFAAQGKHLLEVSTLMGNSPARTFFKVLLPVAKPAIIVGTSLAVLEAVADFGSVTIFNYDTFTTAIYKSWFEFFSFTTAAQLSCILLLCVSLIYLFENSTKGEARYDNDSKSQPVIHLKGWQAWAATLVCLLVFTVSFLLPIIELVFWSIQATLWETGYGYLRAIAHTLALGGMAAIGLVIVVLITALIKRHHPKKHIYTAVAITRSGYVLPGSILAVGFVMAINVPGQLFPEYFSSSGVGFLTGGGLALLLAYMVRFYAATDGPISNALTRIGPELSEAGQNLGANPWRLFHKVYFPLLTPGIMTATLLVFVEVARELPATLLIRPFGWDTLAVKVYTLTAEDLWVDAALPALTLVITGFIPILLLSRRR